MKESTSNCNCNSGSGDTVNEVIQKALTKFKSTVSFTNLTKLSDLGLIDPQLSVLLYTLEGKFKMGLGCPLPVNKLKNMTIIELKTLINKNNDEQK